MHIKPMIAAAVLSAGFAAVAMGSATTTSTPAGVSAPSLRLAQATDTATKATKKSHRKHKSKKTTATDTMSSPK